jgi:cell division septum initiation protein DivIVA
VETHLSLYKTEAEGRRKMDFDNQQENINALIENVTFRKKLFGVNGKDVRACLDDIATMYEELFNELKNTRDIERAEFLKQIEDLKTQNAELTQQNKEKENLLQKAQSEKLLAQQALSKAEPTRDAQVQVELRQKLFELEEQRKIYAARAESLSALLTEQNSIREKILSTAQNSANEIVNRAKKEAEAILATAHEKVRRHTEKEEQAMQSITQKGRDLQKMIVGLRDQVGALGVELERLQERAGELKMLRALREQVEELSMELDKLQKQSEGITDRGGYEPPLPVYPDKIEQMDGEIEKKELSESSISPEKALTEREQLYAASRRARAEEIERQKAVLEALLERQAQDEATFEQRTIRKAEEERNRRAEELSAKLAQAMELLNLSLDKTRPA